MKKKRTYFIAIVFFLFSLVSCKQPDMGNMSGELNQESQEIEETGHSISHCSPRRIDPACPAHQTVEKDGGKPAAVSPVCCLRRRGAVFDGAGALCLAVCGQGICLRQRHHGTGSGKGCIS